MQCPSSIVAQSGFCNERARVWNLSRKILKGILQFAVLTVLTGASPAALAQKDQSQYKLNIPRQRLTTALSALGKATGLQIAYLSEGEDVVVDANAVVGVYSAEAALKLLLAGSGFEYRIVNARTIAIVRESRQHETPTTQDGAKTAIATKLSSGESRNKKSGAIARLFARLFGCSPSTTGTSCVVDASKTPSLAEVVVTAQRRQENLQKAPVAVTAVAAEVFQKLGGGDVSVLQMVVPNVQISTNGSGGGQIGIRGITTANTTDVGDPAVAFEIDGVYQARAQTQGSTLFDVDRIEVLRGPQGTLYGRNATTGVINVISKRPASEFSAEGYIEVGNYRAFTSFAALNAPVSDSVALRAAFISVNHDPTYDNGLTPSRNYGDQHENAGRLHLLIKPDEDWSVLLTGNYSRLAGNGGPFAMLFPSVPLDSTPYKFQASEPGVLDLEQWSGGAVIDWTMLFGTLTYDGAIHRSSLYDLIGANVPGPALTVIADPLNSRTQQHELRLANATDRFKYVAGVYFFDEHQVWNIYVRPAVAFLMPNEKQDSKAAYGQATYSMTDALRLTAGLRYTKDRKTRSGGNYSFDSSGNTALVLPNFADIGSSKINYRVGADYDFARAAMIYANYATGYKAGGFFDGAPPNNTYAPENVASAEFGLKSRFLNSRLQLNVAVFNYKYTDFQVSYQDRATLITKT